VAASFWLEAKIFFRENDFASRKKGEPERTGEAKKTREHKHFQ